ncbi:prop effector [Ramlibacter sp. AW1]|uniref:Prop effector n=1 Tax=Ramlibacter aurantiacus TaxID=2801330 RepID=A0A937D256_9BURK|nr:ProQ/FINO family protein [Ramlibacter aurantiacus]MBL0421234.1 prop effector [Ramlibacter aurantiacus]
MQESQTPPRQARPQRRPARPQRDVHPLLQRLWELHPRLFGARFRPLKIGIFEDLMTRHPGAFEKDQLKAALAQHVRSTRYLESVANGEDRCDLDGEPVEPVALEHVQHAILEVFRRRQSQGRGEASRGWAVARLAQAVQASGLAREAYLERVRTQDTTALGLLDEAFGQVAAETARREALVRAYRASGKSPEEFAEMYGLDVAVVRQAIGEPSGA